ncbi:MAG: ABC transporter permease [Polyangiaceae bacterium]|nr:ABC transporter permease [Polyangiaceae bacterium]
MVSTLDRKLIRDLLRLRGQVITIALVVAAGIAAFIAMKGNYASLERARDAYYERTRFADVFVHLERAPEAVRADLERIPGVARVETRVAEGGMIPLETMSEPIRAQLLSLPAGGRSTLSELYLVEGRMMESGHNDEAVLLESFARAHGLRPGDELPIVINGVLRRLRVVGVAMSPEYIMALAAGEMTQDPKRFAVVWMDRAPLAAAFEMEGAFNDAQLELQPDASEAEVIQAVDALLSRYGSFGAIPRSKQLSNQLIEGELLQMRSMSTVVPSIFLAVAALLLNVVLSRLVHLQRSEIAALKAIGYHDIEIGAHFLKLVLVISGLGSLLGVLAGIWLGRALTNLYGQFFKFPTLDFRLDLTAIGIALGISFASAFAGAFGAVRKVMALPPAEAMRAPAPARYRRSSLDVLRIRRLFGPAAQMIVRELERQPLRTAGSASAIAASVGLLVVAGWYSEGLDALMYTQFHEVMREDVVVVFSEPQPERSVRELGHLPGVVGAEGMRSVPVKFVNGSSSREGVIHGYADDGTMRTLRDRFGRPVAPPPDGVVLTDLLGEILGVEVGDTLEVHVREGARPLKRLTVSGFVDEGFGLQGHMRVAALRDFLDEEPLVSTGLLRIDPALEKDLDERLKAMPHVVSVTKRADILAQFRDQSGAMIATMTFMITLFAAIITVGVVYNNARVALSLRARDLASLRVLGFHRSEISAILLGEMAIQVLIALPLGMWFGSVLVHGIASTVDPEQFRLPIVLTAKSYAYAALVALVASVLSALLVRRKLDQLDLIGVLKTRE